MRDGEAAAFISAGNTGAAMAIAMFTLGVLPGVDRPAIAAVLPNKRGRTILLDVGANIDPKPWHLAQYAVMGHVYARDIYGVAEPRVGLLSVGEEEGKGNELAREVFKRLEESPINFIGNVEGRDVYNGSADVVVTDGFTGNVVLKVSESLADMLVHLLREEMSRSPATKLARAARPPGVPPALEAGRLHGDGRRAAPRHQRGVHHRPRGVAGAGREERDPGGRGVGQGRRQRAHPGRAGRRAGPVPRRGAPRPRGRRSDRAQRAASLLTARAHL